MKILAVGRQRALLEELEQSLLELDSEAEIIKETDALMAGKYAFHHAVDIVFAEADMKRMNGFDLIRFVRQEHPGVKSFLIGSEQELSEAFLILSDDVTGILPYPFAKNAIREALRRGGQ